MPEQKKKGPTGLWAALEKLLTGNIVDPNYDPVSEINAELVKSGVPAHIAEPITKRIVNKPGEFSDEDLKKISSPKVKTKEPVAKSPKTPHIVGR
jgi:hypothetical protein